MPGIYRGKEKTYNSFDDSEESSARGRREEKNQNEEVERFTKSDLNSICQMICKKSLDPVEAS